ncbi:carboxypeptidase-like regulatory domain-containing protein [Amniculibacterium aquaticum]|uniref:carboxypeptidase-like regulatory domain-containing protein n=1 Tax=Amniculibacterium aquaticum TaxID=2479858 RepID=UPI000F5A7E70|nr:carboxypeptidase-like regulatory domain-containing protein [Amniculibacterium aquaticum]
MKKKIIFFIIILFSKYTFAQVFAEGFVFDENSKTPIFNASILVSNLNNEIIAYTFSKNNGEFKINIKNAGEYKFSINKAGYEKVEQQIHLNSANNIKINFDLSKVKIKEIKEVIITSSKPIKIKKDTIELDAKAFMQGNENSLEDLLKKLPGLNVDNSGVIKVGNKEIEKIMIENDDFFGKGYSIISKNMSIKPIDKIQIIEHYSNNKHLKGIENSDKVALNLKLKNDAKKEWFGTIYLMNSTYPNKNYDSKINLMSFGKKSKYFFLANANNIGFDAVGSIRDLISPVNDTDFETNTKSIEAYSPFYSSIYLPSHIEVRGKFNNDKMVSANSIININPKLKIKFLTFYNNQNQNYFNHTNINYDISNNPFKISESNDISINNNNIFGKVELNFDRKLNQTINYIIKYNYSQKQNNNSIIYNSQPTLENISENKKSTDQTLSFTNKFNEKEALITSLRFIDENSPSQYTLNHFFYEELFPNTQTSSKAEQAFNSKLSYFNFNARYLNKKKNDNLFEILLSFENNQQKLNSLFAVIDSVNKNTYTNPLFSNDMQYSYSSIELSSKYTYIINKFELIPNIKIIGLDNRLTTNKYDRNKKILLNPSIDLKWDINKKSNISINSFFNQSNVEIQNLIPNYINNRLRQFSKGYGHLTFLRNYGGSIFYNYGSWTDRFFFNNFINYTNFLDYLSDSSFIYPNYVVSDEILVRNKQMLLASSTFNYYLKKIASNIKITINGGYNTYFNKINSSELRKITTINYSYGLGVKSGWKKSVNFDFGFTRSENFVKISSSKKTSNWNSYFDVIGSFGKKTTFQLSQELYNIGNTSNSYSSYYFADLKGKYLFNDKITFNLTFNNIFNAKEFITKSINDLSVTEINYSLYPRNLMVGAELRF